MGNFAGRRAFTLIELLIVVSIISILIAFLLAGLSGSRENARAVICKSNLRQWGVAMHAHQTEREGMLPYEDRGDEDLGHHCWFDVLSKRMTSVDPNATDENGNPIEPDDRVLVCPTVYLHDPNRLESYRMNSKLAETNPTSPHYMPYRNINTLKEPVKTVVLFDGDVGGDVVSFKGRWRLENDDVNYRHNFSCNLLFADNHAENMMKQALSDKSKKNDRVIWQPPDIGPWNPNPNPGP